MSYVPTRTASDINAVCFTIEAEGVQVLSILLAADGTINRSGTGTLGNRHNDLFIGVVQEPLFDKLMKHFDDEMLNHTGGYEMPQRRGVPCKLSIALSFREGDSDGFAFRYGSESQGPPIEIMELVRAAVTITDPWFHEQLRRTGNAAGNQQKPWWKFW